jgi:mannose-6-phosphate isomerase-like protein (cupin superfamily)
MLQGDRMYQKRISTFWEEQVFPAGQPVQRIELQRTQFQSIQAVRFVANQKPQRNSDQDFTMFMRSGGGTLYINNFPTPLSSGDVVTVPRGAAHYFVNTSTTTVSEAILVYSPPAASEAASVSSKESSNGHRKPKKGH